MKTVWSSLAHQLAACIPPSFRRPPALAAACFLVLLAPVVRAQESAAGRTLALSYTGQFVVTGSTVRSPLLSLPAVITNTSLVQLEPALLSVSAERIKQTLDRLLGVPPGTPYQGKIYLALHTALWTDENVTVVSRPIDQGWSYFVELPDVVQRSRLMRGITGALLLELANRQSVNGQSGEVPGWLTDGLSRQMVLDELAKVVVSAPDRPFDDPPAPKTVQREIDPLSGAREVLRNHPVLTFDQISWPTDAQVAGADDGVYLASAQLLVSELLRLPGGAAHMRDMLASLPQYRNWQTAFFTVWHDRFPRPLDLEKWWALTVVDFLAHDPGPEWTAAYSAGRLNELLAVQVELRSSSNSLPSFAEIPLQTAVYKLNAVQKAQVFQIRLRDLRIAELRMATRFAVLADDYCRVLAGCLGEHVEPKPGSYSNRHARAEPEQLSAREAVKRLNELDAQRWALEGLAPAGRARKSPNLNAGPARPVNLTGAGSQL